MARVLLADSLRGANWPGSEKAVNLVESSAMPMLTVSSFYVLYGSRSFDIVNIGGVVY